MKIVLKILKISIIVFVIGCISFFIYLFGGQILGISEILSVHKSILKTPHININDLKNDFEIIIDVVNREKYETFYFDESSDYVIGGYIDSKMESEKIDLNEKELQAFKHVFYGIKEVKRSLIYQFDKVIYKDKEIIFSNSTGYQVVYIPNDNKKTLKELKKEEKNKYFSVIKLDEHWYQMMP